MGKRAPGGLRGGLLIWEYMDIFPLKSEDRVPTAIGMRIAMISVLLSFTFTLDTPKYP